MERYIVETAGVTLIGGAAYGVSSFYSLSNLDKRFSKNVNQAIFCLIPVITYVLYRVYFLLLFRVTSIGRFSLSRPIVCKCTFVSCCWRYG